MQNRPQKPAKTMSVSMSDVRFKCPPQPPIPLIFNFAVRPLRRPCKGFVNALVLGASAIFAALWPPCGPCPPSSALARLAPACPRNPR